jgi:hypothetical protein
MRKLVALTIGVAAVTAAAGLAPIALARAGGADAGRQVPAAAGLTSPRHDCELFLPVDVTSHIYTPDPNLGVTINNGDARRDVVIQLSAEGATTETTIRGKTIIGLRYSVDGGSFDVHGPEFFFSEPNFETHTNMSVVPLGPGSHTIVPGYVIWTGEGTGQVLFRCLSVEFGR